MKKSKKNPATKTRQKPKRSFAAAFARTVFIGAVVLAVLVVGGYFLADYAVTRYFDSWGNRLAMLERRGLLSKEVGAGWADVLAGQKMDKEAQRIIHGPADNSAPGTVVEGVSVDDYPSLSIIDRLREVREYSNSIEITDCHDKRLAMIKTDHSRAPIGDFPPTLVTALIAAEDGSFMTNNHGFSFGSFVRAAVRSVVESIVTHKKVPLRGTSTITQQVAKLFISRLDATGRRHVGRTIDRKLRELRLAAALRKLYQPDDILEVYLNHCVTSDYGLVGYKDIAAGLFNKDLNQLSDAQCIYLSRMVKWGRNAKEKIRAQCRIDMPRMGKALGWDREKQREVLAQIDSLTFTRPKRIEAAYGSLVDCANEFWLMSLRHNGFSEQEVSQMDFLDPSSLIRKKGNLKISLTIDSALQKEVENLVNSRGYGPDGTVLADVRIASSDTVIRASSRPQDLPPRPRVLSEPIDFREPSSAVITSLNPGDTVYDAVTWKKIGPRRYRRTSSTVVRKPVTLSGQYYAYALMDSRTGKLLAYYSRDKLGSRLAGLLRNRIPNGSSTAKPIFNALNFDLGNFMPYSKWSDRVDVADNVPWKHRIAWENGKPAGVTFAHSAVKGRGYTLHNHNDVFDGCRYIFDLLATSNNVFGVESEYRLNRQLFDGNGEVASDAFPLVQLFYRLGDFQRIKDSLGLTTVTGVRVYKELVRIAGIDEDSLAQASGKPALASDSMYSAALGTLELSLFEQMHLFNMLYNNDLIVEAANHPSLVLNSVVLNGDTVALNDTVMRVHPFSDINNLRPTWLGMHKRLVSNPADGLASYDIPLADPDSAGPEPVFADGKFHPEAFTLRDPPSNFAKSGTSDDIIKPFDAPYNSTRKTDYGIWNAVIRLNLGALRGDTAPDVRDVTVACIGECNTKYTGYRDGKTLHRFLTAGLLKRAGIPVSNGFYSQYEAYLKRVTPPGENCGSSEGSATDQEVERRGD